MAVDSPVRFKVEMVCSSWLLVAPKSVFTAPTSVVTEATLGGVGICSGFHLRNGRLLRLLFSGNLLLKSFDLALSIDLRLAPTASRPAFAAGQGPTAMFLRCGANAALARSNQSSSVRWLR